ARHGRRHRGEEGQRHRAGLALEGAHAAGEPAARFRHGEDVLMRGQGVAILRRVAAVVALSALFSVAATRAAEVATPSPARADDDPLREILDATHRDGLDGILKRRILRVLVVPSRTDYFTDRGKQ